ncbi:folate-binding protein YgfZ [Martelella alba]|uniref:Folate-binding protein YgfZ n=1 Tax=Martelella alba TaxID=2590451 RepID=A0A506UJK0_9HYPH|nr:folate-binding protein YgfZ [Martelella alba]TPW33433.1 folate-binding protein YgfZ [Martelella alba]
MATFHLAERSRIAIGGPDAEHFLQNLVTTDIESMKPEEAWPGALLTPQGKIWFDFLIARDGDGFVVETDTADVDALVKRLMIYRLRAKVTIDLMAGNGTIVTDKASSAACRDMRFEQAGIELFRAQAPAAITGDGMDGYAQLRVAAGVAEMNRDYASQDAFPHDVLMDRNGALSFTKGCYVGQEVVSRMQHRGTARRRVAHVAAAGNLPASGTVLIAAGKPVGTLGTISGTDGLAIVRIDRIGEAEAAGQPVTADGLAVTVTPFAWSGLTFAPSKSED